MGRCTGDHVLLKAKIKANYLDAIIAGKKTMEFRQFAGDDKMVVTDENGREVELKINSVHEASDEMASAIRRENADIRWNEVEPIMVIKVQPA